MIEEYFCIGKPVDGEYRLAIEFDTSQVGDFKKGSLATLYRGISGSMRDLGNIGWRSYFETLFSKTIWLLGNIDIMIDGEIRRSSRFLQTFNF